ncbi:MBL fold metallo-hydrolase [bacterium]|nr:MBL fold metallo-hydrolase [bacterium]
MTELSSSGEAELVVLGSGTSHGVPMIACDCPVCRSDNPKNQRTRCSVLLRKNDFYLLVDTATDFRQQALREKIPRVDAVLYTHSHADHVFGLDDLRRYNYSQPHPIPIYSRPDVLEDLERIFSYIFHPAQAGGGVPRIRLISLPGPMRLGPFHVEPIPVFHGQLEINAYRFGDLAYVTDVSRIPPASLERLAGVRTLILDALRYQPHPTHFNLDQAIAVVELLKPERAYFTHIAHNLDHDAVNAQLPPHIELSYDGLRLAFKPDGNEPRI